MARFGDPERRDRWLDAAAARHGEAVAPELARCALPGPRRSACSARPRARFGGGGGEPRRPRSARASCSWRATPQPRRRPPRARRLLGQTIDADPDGRAAAAARALLEP
ncbi:MAG: hypothetical protein KF878_21440 [Planctomycetes bacterium]|nr:hypothetical protein [Planctomycetota bacterium]